MAGLVTKNADGYVTVNIPPDVARVLFPNEMTDDEIGAMVQEFINNYSGLEGIKVANNLTTTNEGFVLDARQGNLLSEEVKYRYLPNIETKLYNDELGTESNLLSVTNRSYVMSFGKHILFFRLVCTIPPNTPLGDANENMLVKITSDNFIIPPAIYINGTMRSGGKTSRNVCGQTLSSENGIAIRGIYNDNLHEHGTAFTDAQLHFTFTMLVPDINQYIIEV